MLNAQRNTGVVTFFALGVHLNRERVFLFIRPVLRRITVKKFGAMERNLAGWKVREEGQEHNVAASFVLGVFKNGDNSAACGSDLVSQFS
jgi:hypothetical protein